MVVGIDEVGRGSWAGPLVACATVLSENFFDRGIRDSKQIALEKRASMARLVLSNAISVGIGWASPQFIDKHGVTTATSRAMQRALDELKVNVETVHIDGNYNYLPHIDNVELFIKGDAKVQHIAAASIVAKVTRDRFMKKMDKLYPGYGFCTNVGYGSFEHKEALGKHGTTPLHRLSWKPIAELQSIQSK